MNDFLIENGVESYEMDGIGQNDLISFFKMVDHYKTSLDALERRYAMIDLIRYFIENPDLIGLPMNEIFEKVKEFLHVNGNNLLTYSLSDDQIHIFVQTKGGMEELLINDELFAAPHFNEANYIYQKIKEWDLKIEGDLVKVLEEVKDFAKKGSYIQRYKGLGEMNPEQLWETTMTPENRVLLRVAIEDAELASDTFTLFMGDEVEPRRNYIETHAKDVKHLDV